MPNPVPSLLEWLCTLEKRAVTEGTISPVIQMLCKEGKIPSNIYTQKPVIPKGNMVLFRINNEA